MTRSYRRDVVIRRAPEDVFAFLSDLTHELEWNPRARSVERLTAGPLGVGTRYGAQWAGTPATIVEVVRFEPPRTWMTRSRSMGMVIEVEGSVEPHPDGCRYSMRLRLAASGLARLFAPLAFAGMRRQDAGNMELIQQALESSPSWTAS